MPGSLILISKANPNMETNQNPSSLSPQNMTQSSGISDDMKGQKSPLKAKSSEKKKIVKIESFEKECDPKPEDTTFYLERHYCTVPFYPIVSKNHSRDSEQPKFKRKGLFGCIDLLDGPNSAFKALPLLQQM